MKATDQILIEPPPAAGASAPPQPRPVQAHEASNIRANILMVDDRADKLLALETILAPLGENLVKARSGKEALRHLLKQDFAVILLDVSMPEMDGFETASLIRQRLSSEHTPIIFVTSFGNSENHISQGYSIGAVDYIMTPIVPNILRAKVSVFVELHRKGELIKRQSEMLRQLEETRHRREMAEVVDRLEQETKRNRFFTMSMDLLGIAGRDLLWVQTNPSWSRILGYSPEELNGRAVLEFCHPEDCRDLTERFERLGSDPFPVQTAARWRHKDGTWHWLDVTAAPFSEENLTYVFARDITAQREADSRIVQLNRELEGRVTALTEANRELEAFNYSIAHDLRSPLRSMNGFAQALLETEASSLSEVGADYTHRIARAAKYMDHLLHDLLIYSSFGRGELDATAVKLDEPMTELLAVLEPEIRERKATVEINSPLGEVQANLPTLKQVMANLVGNSLKFRSPERPLRVKIYSTPQPGYVRLWVEDNGIGIAPEHHERIFGLFTRLHGADAYPGTGIGLALVRRGAERMGGHAGVESTPGQGSRFWIDIPVKKTDVTDGNSKKNTAHRG